MNLMKTFRNVSFLKLKTFQIIFLKILNWDLKSLSQLNFLLKL